MAEINEKRTRALLSKFSSHLEHTSRLGMAWIIFLVLIIAWGGVGLYFQVVKGHGVTGMRDHVVWGIYIANFIFFIGISYAGAVISGVLHLMNAPWRKPIIRIAELITVISTIIGPVYILLCVGRLDRLHHLVIFGRLQSPITWDVLAIATYLVGSIIFLYLALIKDFALLRESPELKVGKWKKKLYKFLSLGYINTPKQNRLLSKSNNLMAIMIIPMAIIVHSVLSWIFGMTLRPGWHSTIFGPYFVVAAIYSGTGALIIVLWVFRKIYHLQEFITIEHFKNLALILIVLGAIYGYFTFSEYMTDWYGSKVWESKLLERLFDLEQYGVMFWAANIFGVLIPILVLSIPRFRTINIITLVSVFMVLALWLKRYLIIVPTLETPLLPMQEIRPEYINYSITWVEWALTFGGLATFALMFTLAAKFVPIIPVWDMAEQSKAESS